jgi:hypothetical protein
MKSQPWSGVLEGWTRKRDGSLTKKGRASALKPSTLRSTQDAIERGGKPDMTALMHKHMCPTSRENLLAPMQEGANVEKIAKTLISN